MINLQRVSSFKSGQLYLQMLVRFGESLENSNEIPLLYLNK